LPQSELQPISVLVSRPRNDAFGHIARLRVDVPANQALHCYVNCTLGRLPNSYWRRWPCRPRTTIPPADLWRRAIRRGHRGATLRPLRVMRWWRYFPLYTV